MGGLDVIVVGAGTGGLALAHGLRAAGVAVRVFERDHRLSDRSQGYRLNINGGGARALQSCLPASNFDRYIAASARVSTAVTFLDHKLRRLASISLPAAAQSAPDAARPISRIALRELLGEGLEDITTFGKTFDAYEMAPDGPVTVHFEDGSSVQGDILVGADGAASRIRRQLLPHAQRIDTGVVMVTGKVPLDAAVRRDAPAAVFAGPTLILGPPGTCMFTGAVEYPPGHLSGHDSEEYVMWGFSARREVFGLKGSAEIAMADARAAVLARMSGWSPDLRRLVERAEASSLSSFAIKSSVPIAPWATGRVTLLGDALHNMTPFRGIGANTALRDAALLRDTLSSVSRGERGLRPALAAYEREMIGYGFAAVRASLDQAKRLHAASPLSRMAGKAFFRLLDLSPRLLKKVLDVG
jgi:2-polyprenyl-6-methoxyphenol hydroxylase-like FAD-dependent oxidoreductase